MLICPKCNTATPALHAVCCLCGQINRSSPSTPKPAHTAPVAASIDVSFSSCALTALRVITAPRHYFRDPPFRMSVALAFFFALAAAAIGSICDTVWSRLLPLPANIWQDISSGNITNSSLVFFPFFTAGALLLATVYCHTMLRLTGIRTERFTESLRVICIAQAASLFAIIPYFGTVIGGLWGLFIAMTGLAHIHHTTRLRVLRALALPLIICAVLGIILLIAAAGTGIMINSIFKDMLSFIR